ncbi:MAG: ABC-ATPase domain-containing protein [Actinomycetaceae bacterium]|nr:ABC-ATPase domain-containing protein [Actinomycetaceae bacterium]
MRDADRLISLLHRLDAKPYGAYKQIGDDTWDYGDFTINVTKVQSDPYAPASHLRIRMGADVAGIPNSLLKEPQGRVAIADFIARTFARATRRGPVSIAPCGQEILNRSSVKVTECGDVELRACVHLPARGRRIKGHEAARIFDEILPDAIYDACDFLEGPESLSANLTAHVYAHTDYLALTSYLAEHDLVAFLADGSILARVSGISDLPLERAIALTSPDTLAHTVRLPHAGLVRGLAIPKGITTIVGGGYHGKSTLLNAIERGVYPHIPGDGRELVATVPHAMKVKAEDGRACRGVDISLFISDLPRGSDTTHFFTDNASGSTSQAAAISEALEAGSQLLLIDEDTSATNLMIRDERMRVLVDTEPITPLVDRIEGLRSGGVSTILVMGGSGDYLDAADTVIGLDHYAVADLTERARELCARHPRPTRPDTEPPHPPLRSRVLHASPTGTEGKRPKTSAKGTHTLTLDRTSIDISALEQVVDPAQAEALAWIVRAVVSTKRHVTMRDFATEVTRRIEREGLDWLCASHYPPHVAQPRPVDIVAALSRYRALRVQDTPRT